MGKAACPWRAHSLNSLVLQVRWLQHGMHCWCCRSEMEIKLEKKRSKTIEGHRKNSHLQSLGITVIITEDKAWLSQKSLSYWCGLMTTHGKNQLVHWHSPVISLSSVNMPVLLEHPLWNQTSSGIMVTWAGMQKSWGKNNWRVRTWNIFSSTFGGEVGRRTVINSGTFSLNGRLCENPNNCSNSLRNSYGHR